MASLTADIGRGATLTLATDTWEATAEITSIEWSGITREFVETTHLGTTLPLAGFLGSRTYLPLDHTDGGTIAIEFNFNPDLKPAFETAAETITVTWLGPDDGAGATWVASGFWTEYGTGPIVENEKMTGSGTFKITGTITITADA